MLKPKTSNQLRNINSYIYLKHLADTIPEKWRQAERGPFAVFGIVFLLKDKVGYDANFCYGNLYTTFMQTLEDYIEKNPDDYSIRRLVLSAFINRNDALELTHKIIAKSIKKCVGEPGRIQSVISADLPDAIEGEALNAITPLKRETTTEKLLDAIVRDNFKPQTTTSQPSVRTYAYQLNSDPMELRLGTQAQRHAGQYRVSPLFKQFLQFQQLPTKPYKITHVYFNDLGKDRLPYSLNIFSAFRHRTERDNEAAFTQQLENLETNHTNIAVITLPADKGIMAHSYIRDTSVVTDPFKKLLDITLGQSPEPVQDFYISHSVRRQLFNEFGNYSKEIEAAVLKQLLFESFRALGFKTHSPLTKAKYQAVWFYFTKYKLTNFILKKLNPLTFQMSCKDGIDRGGAHSAMYNLLKSFEPGRTPMTREEFERAIDAAPTLVKGRGMNDHRERLWNVINFYVEANYKSLEQSQGKQWLLRWHADNTPTGIPRSTEVISFAHAKSKVTIFEYEKSQPTAQYRDSKPRSLTL